jgi:hypothetical protein
MLHLLKEAHMTNRVARAWWTAVVTLGIAASASAQPAVDANEWSHGTTLNVFAGVADAGARSPIAGGAIGWQLTRTTAIEGAGSWMNRRRGAEGFAGTLKLQTMVGRIGIAAPFVEAGIGAYRASFDTTSVDVPAFYRARMSDRVPAVRTRRSFTDPTIVFGGGVSVRASRNMAIRPAVDVTVVLRNSDTHVITAAVLRLAYHFEDHPVTRVRKGR